MSYTRFNRHESMSKEIFERIGKILNEDLYDRKIGVTRDQRWSVQNELYGLYDGYLYDDLIVNAESLPEPVRTKIRDLWWICRYYPKSETQIH